MATLFQLSCSLAYTDLIVLQGDFHQWVDLFNHFDSFFDKYIKARKDLQVEDNFLGSDPPFPKDAVLQILRVTRIILENCSNKHFYSSYEVSACTYVQSYPNLVGLWRSCIVISVCLREEYVSGTFVFN